jgi:predicted RNA-binding Zn ribbon-like protein
VKIMFDVLCVQFINSEFRDFRGRWARDDLQRPEWLQQFLATWGLQVEEPPDAAVIASLVSLRALLVRMLAALPEGNIADDDLAQFNAILRKASMHRTLIQDAGTYRFELIPAKKDWDWVQAEIAASFAQLAAHDPKRLKICENYYCRGAFYDDTKSRTQRYCTPEKCGSLMKARRFRTRHKVNR